MDISDLKNKCAASNFRPDKRLGQNFLIDRNIRDKILGFLPVTKDTQVLEIGPGFGMMTESLSMMAKKVFAVEKDKELCRIMKSDFLERKNVELISSDILEVDLEEIQKRAGGKLFVYGNVPYNITSLIIEKIIAARSVVDGLYMVIQEEVASRLCAAPGTKIYGSISCFVQYYASVRKIFRISKNCFFPKPKVGSCLIGLNFFKEPFFSVKDEEMMFLIIRKAFSQRRKKVLNPLASDTFLGLNKDSWMRALTAAGIDPQSRAEDISLEEYTRISNEVVELLR